MSNVVTCFTPGSPWDRAAEGMLGEAERVARSVGARHVVVAGSSQSDLIDHVCQHADQVIALDDPEYTEYHPESCLAVLHAVCSDLQPRVVFLSQDTYSQEISARLGKRLGGCSIGDAQRVEIEADQFQVTRNVYGGKAMAKVQANAAPVVIWLRARAFASEPARQTAVQAETRTALTDQNRPAAMSQTHVIDRQRDVSAGVRLEDAQVIVAGGRGLGGPEPFEALAELAAVMGGQQAASRAACDAGWVPANWQVGQTGKKVAPELYLAVAISGASQHLMGIADAHVVAAINTDPDAAIFRRCDFGLVEDWKNIVQPLTKELATRKH